MLDNYLKNCIIDLRISSTKQQSGNGLEDQERACLNFANNQNWKVIKIFSKIYSGRAEEREDFEEILRFIKEQKSEGIKVDYYVVKEISRFTRNGAITFLEMKNRLSYLGVELSDVYRVIQQEQNTLAHLDVEYEWSKKSPTAAVQLLEANRAKEDVTDALSRMIGAEITLEREGYKIRGANDGFINQKTVVLGKDRVIEVPDPKRVHFFVQMFELRAKGVDDQEIVRRINAIGFRTKSRYKREKYTNNVIGRSGNCPLTIKQFQRFIQRTIYAGIKCTKWTNYQPIKAQYSGLISVETFNLANRGKVFIQELPDSLFKIIYNYKSFNKTILKRLKNNPEFPYKFFLCDVCRKPYVGSSSQGKAGTKYPGYHCGGHKNGPRAHKFNRIPRKEFHENIENFLQSLRFHKEVLINFETVLNDVYRQREKEIVREASLINYNVSDLKDQQATVLEALIVTPLGVVRKKLEEKIEKLEKDIHLAEEQREEIEITEKDIKSFIRFVKKVMEHPSELLITEGGNSVREKLIELVFEETPTYQEIVNGTPKLSCIFTLLRDYDNDLKGQKSHIVPRAGVEPT